MSDLLTLIERARTRLRYEDETLDQPIMVKCLDCGTSWYSQHPVIQCEECYSPVVCTPVAACRSCYRAVVNVTAGMRCEHCRSTDIVIEGTPGFPYATDAEWERRCRKMEGEDFKTGYVGTVCISEWFCEREGL